MRPCSVLVDVGTDHALLPLAALARGLAGRAIAIDRAASPLAGAAENRRLAGLEDRLALRQGSGLAPLGADRADVVTIAGMGGQLAARLLCEAAERLSGFRQVIVQPNQQPEHVRRWAAAAGWHLEAEAMVEEQGRFFPVLAFRPGSGPDPAYVVPGFSREELELLGPLLLASANPVAARHARAQRDRLTHLPTSLPQPSLSLWNRALCLLSPREGGQKSGVWPFVVQRQCEGCGHVMLASLYP